MGLIRTQPDPFCTTCTENNWTQTLPLTHLSHSSLSHTRLSLSLSHSLTQWALALDKMLKGTAATSVFPRSKLIFPAIAEANVASALKAHLRGTGFDGASGRVTIESKTQDRGSLSFLVAQISPGRKGTRPIASYSQAMRAFSTTAFNVDGTTGFNITWPTLDGAPPKEQQSFTFRAPVVLGVLPAVGNPAGNEQIRVLGTNFGAKGAGSVSVTIAGQLCRDPMLVSSSELTCLTAPGTGGPLPVVVFSAGLSNRPQYVFSYRLPVIYSISRKWAQHGSLLHVVGAYFTDNQLLRCRIAGQAIAALATFVDTSHLTCNINFNFDESTTAGAIFALEVSNDGGYRWADGMTIDSPVHFYGGSTTPLSTTTFPKDVFIAAMVPGVAENPKLVQTFKAAAAAANAVFFPHTTLHAHIIDTHGDATVAEKAVVEYATNNANGTQLLVGIVGGRWSTTTIPVARAVSNPLQIPMVAYDAWSGVLDDPILFPYFLRTCPASSDLGRVLKVLFTSMFFKRAAVWSSDDAYAQNIGNLVQTMAIKAPTMDQVVTPELDAKLDMAGVQKVADTVMLPLAQKIRDTGTRITFITVANGQTMTAMLLAMKKAGILGPGYAVVVSSMSDKVKYMKDNGVKEMDGIVGLQPSRKVPCTARWCPPSQCVKPGGCNLPEFVYATAYDAFYALAQAIGPIISGKDGGANYLQKNTGARKNLMAKLRRVTLPASLAASGPLQFHDSTNKRNMWDFGYTLLNSVWVTTKENSGKNANATTLQIVEVGNVGKHGFVPTVGVPIRWLGGSSERPLDSNDGAAGGAVIPKALTVAVVFDHIYGTAWYFERLLMYVKQAVKEVNADPNLIPHTQLILDYETMDSTGWAVSKRDSHYASNHILIATRAANAGRPVAAFLPGLSNLATVGLSRPWIDPVMKMVPQIGVGTGAPHLQDPVKYPNFVRLFPPIYFSEQLYLKFALYNNWDTMAVFADKNDAYDRSILAFLNSTGRRAKGPYTPPQVTIAQAELVDMSAMDTDAIGLETRLHAKLARAKAMDIRIFHLAFNVKPCIAFVRAMIKLGMAGSRDYLIHVDRTSVQSALTQGTLPPDVAAALDGAIAVTAVGLVNDGKGYAKARAFWQSNVPVNETTESFFLPGQDDNYNEFGFIYDGVGVLAAALEACLADRCQLVSGGNVNGTVVMPYLRQISYDGVAGTAAFEEGSNDPRGRLFDLTVANARAVPFRWDHVTRSSALYQNLEICKSPNIGQGCQKVAAPPGTVQCFASSDTSIDIMWESAVAQGGGLISGYRVTMSAGKEIAVANLGASGRHVTFTTNAGGFGSKRVVLGALYAVSVETLYDDNMIVSKTTNCLSPQNGLPCLPPPVPIGGSLTASKMRDTLVVGKIDETNNNGVAVCGCKSTEYHAQGLPGYPSRYWECKPCVEGTDCVGGSATTVRTTPGWFISGNYSTKYTSLGKNGSKYSIGFPKLWQCPGGASACPGGKLVVPFLSRDNMSVGPCGDSALSGTECQCGAGHVGMLCRTCKDDWVVIKKSGVSTEGLKMVADVCQACTLDKPTMFVIFASVIVVVLILSLVATCVYGKVTRAPRIELAFFDAFSNMQSVGAAHAVNAFFGKGSSQGVTREVFLAVCSVKLTSGNDNGKGNERTQLIKLYERIDVDGDGVVTLKELVKLLYGLKDGSLSSSKTRRRCSKWLQYLAYSSKSKTLRIVLLTHFQLSSSVTKCFPTLDELGLSSTATMTFSNATDIRNRTVGIKSMKELTTDEMMRVGTEIAGAVGDIDFSFLEFTNCLTGPRHYDLLVAKTTATLAILIIAWYVPELIRLAATRLSCVSTEKRASLSAIHKTARLYGSKLCFFIILVAYPSCTRVILRTFVCTQYLEPSGREGFWLDDDTTIKCANNKAAGSDDGWASATYTSSYFRAYLYAWLMVFIIVFGLPAVLLRMLWPWRYPFNRLYESSEEGEMVPTMEGKKHAGSLYSIYKNECWAQGIITMGIKVFLAAYLGVLFQTNQVRTISV